MNTLSSTSITETDRENDSEDSDDARDSVAAVQPNDTSDSQPAKHTPVSSHGVLRTVGLMIDAFQPQLPGSTITEYGPLSGNASPIAHDVDSAAARYHPCPFDTSAVKITPAIQDLVNLLARQTHEVWARDKLSEGWKYAPDRPSRYAAVRLAQGIQGGRTVGDAGFLV